jgi:hypothetical protein
VIRKRDTAEQIRTKITEALIRDVGISERMARPFVDAVMGCFAGEQPYFPSSEKTFPLLQIRGALEAGETVRAVCRHFSISRSKLHRLFPGGLPRPQLRPKTDTK